MNLLTRFMDKLMATPAMPARVAPTVGDVSAFLPGYVPPLNSERGVRTNTAEMLELLYQRFMPSMGLRSTILEIRDMDKRDPRVKKIHERTARVACRGGLCLKTNPADATAERIQRLWCDFERRCELNNPQKLESDMRGALMEGNTPLQWVIDFEGRSIAKAIRMPTETIRPLVDAAGRFVDPQRAYEQYEWTAAGAIADFALWQLTMVRIRPDNWDNWGSMGRPYLDATRSVWRKLVMTEDDLVVRRHTRAPLRHAHVLEGANAAELEAYEDKVLNKQGMVTTDFFLNKKGGVQAVQGDANLSDIADVAHLLDTFFAGAPAPKGLFGYSEGLNRDILQDLKDDYYSEIDALQDSLAWGYEQGFRINLLLAGINPDAEEFCVHFAERRTETPNQAADTALKWQAIGVPETLVWERAGLSPERVLEHRQAQQERQPTPYPEPNNITRPAPAPGAPRVSITPGNAPKGQSATSISNA